MFKNKKILSLFLLGLMLLSATGVFAQDVKEDIVLTEISEEEYLNRPKGNIGVSETEHITEDGVTPFELSIPSETKNLKYDRYYFSGKAGVSPLYTNYSFDGVDKYYVKVTNYRSDDLKFKVRSNYKIYTNGVCAGDSTRYYTITGMSTSKKIFIEFLAPSDFSGYIEDYNY